MLTDLSNVVIMGYFSSWFCSHGTTRPNDSKLRRAGNDLIKESIQSNSSITLHMYIETD